MGNNGFKNKTLRSIEYFKIHMYLFITWQQPNLDWYQNKQSKMRICIIVYFTKKNSMQPFRVTKVDDDEFIDLHICGLFLKEKKFLKTILFSAPASR